MDFLLLGTKSLSLDIFSIKFFYKILSFAKEIISMFLALSWVCVYILKALRKDPDLSTSFWWPQAFPS